MYWIIAYCTIGFVIFCIRASRAQKNAAWLNKVYSFAKYTPKYIKMAFQAVVWPLWCLYKIIGAIANLF